MKTHWYTPFRGGGASYCGRTKDQTRMTNSPSKVTCIHCLRLMSKQKVKEVYSVLKASH